jgi:general secretion pathway protein I
MTLLLKQNHSGFSLLEVLVAVAILGIALFAVIRSTGQASHTSGYLQEKVSASFLCANLLAQAQLGLIKSPGSGEATLLNTSFHWETQLEKLPSDSDSIAKITVRVFRNNKPLATLNLYAVLKR